MWEFVWQELTFPIGHDYATATDNYMELAARFVVPVREARFTTNELTRRVKARLAEAGIPIASTTSEVTVYRGDEDSGER